MATLIGKAVLIMLLLLFTTTISGEAISFRKKRHIKITNNLDGDSVLTVHCKSKDDDIGVKTLPHGGSYEFRFRPNVFGEYTLFFCSFRWGGEFHYYDVYKDEETEGGNCSKCWYSVMEYGRLCRFNWDTNQYDKCFAWNKD